MDAAAEIAEVMGWASATQLSELAERARLGSIRRAWSLAGLSCPGSTAKKSRRWYLRGSTRPWPCAKRLQKLLSPTCRHHKLRRCTRPETRLSNRLLARMTSPPPAAVLELALQTLEAELVEPERLASFRTVLNTTEPVAEANRFRWYANGQVCLERSAHGTLTFFLPAIPASSALRRLGTFDRQGRCFHFFLCRRWSGAAV